MRRHLTGIVGVGIAVVLFTACGGSDSLPDAANSRLAPQVAAIRLAAESYAPDAARQKLAEVRETVGELRRTGVIDDAQEAKVLAAAAGVEAQLALAPTTTTTTTTTPPRTAPASDDEFDDDSDEKPGNGKGPGKK